MSEDLLRSENLPTVEHNSYIQINVPFLHATMLSHVQRQAQKLFLSFLEKGNCKKNVYFPQYPPIQRKLNVGQYW